jgi:glutathione S-transferase
MQIADTVYFYTPGTCALGGIAVLDWVGEPYTLCRVDREERQSDAYKRINAHGKVPAMRVGAGARVITENGAILPHLADRARARSQTASQALAPEHGTAERDAFNEWLAYLGTGFHASFYPWFGPAKFAKDESAHETVKAAAKEQIANAYAYVDRKLGKSEWLMGGTRTVLDPYFYGMARWGKKILGDLESKYPNVARHHAAMEKEPALAFALAVEKDPETAKAPSGKLVSHAKLADVMQRIDLAREAGA